MKLQKVLDECLRDIQERNDTLEDCLARHPKHAEALEPLLRLATSIREVPPVRPMPAFKRAMRERLLALPSPVEAPPRRSWADILASTAIWLGRRAAVASAVAVLVVLVLSGGAAIAAADSLPDSPLYPVKRVTEQAWLLLMPGDAARAKLHIAYAQRRLDEAVIMAQRGDEGRARELLEEYKKELWAAVAVIEELTAQTTRLNAELRVEVAEQGKTLESTGERLPSEVVHLGLAAAREAEVGLSALAMPSPAILLLSSPTPTETRPAEALATPTMTRAPTTTPTPTGVIGTPPGLVGSPTAGLPLATPTATRTGVTPTATVTDTTPTATQTPPPVAPPRATPTATAQTTPQPTQPTATLPALTRFTPTLTATPPRATPTATPLRATPTATPVPPTPTPTTTLGAYPGATDTPTPTATPVPPTATPTPGAYPPPTDTPTPEPSHTPPSAQRDTPTPTPRPTDTPPPVPTDTPTTVPYPPPGGQ